MICIRWRALLTLVVSLLINQVTFAQPDSKKTGPASTTYWVFLTTGKSTEGTERSEIEQMQAAHLANFARLHQQGKLFTAGPMADPQKKMRGIVVVAAPDQKSLRELFEPDPYVKQGFMTIDAIKMGIAVGKFQGNVDPNTLAEYRLVILEKSMPDGKEVDAKEQAKNTEYCQSIHDAERLCFAGWLSEDKRSRQGILIFRKLDDAVLNSLIAELPAVKSKLWKATTFPLYMSDGIVKSLRRVCCPQQTGEPAGVSCRIGCWRRNPAADALPARRLFFRQGPARPAGTLTAECSHRGESSSLGN